MSANREKMACMEVWGGNSATWSSFVVPGLDLWVHSQPFHGSQAGGDVYYLSSCASGRITRLLVGDVSGHGTPAAPVAGSLRDIMRRNVNFISQDRVVEAVSDEFESASVAGRFATALIATYYSPKKNLELCLAGHPPPLIYRRKSKSWLVPEMSDAASQTTRNMPMGIMEGQQFSSTNVSLSAGDLMLAYTDALFESRDADGNMLLAEGLLQLLDEKVDASEPGLLVPRLLDQLRALNPENLGEDDVTVMLAQANTDGIRLKDNLLAPFRVLKGLFQK